MNAGSTADGAISIQWSETGSLNQNWSFSEVAAIDLTKTYSLTNRNSGKSLGVSNNAATDGATVIQNPSGTASSQSWQFVYDSAGYYKIKNVNSGKFMDVAGSATAGGAEVVQTSGNSSTSQQWQLMDAGAVILSLKIAMAVKCSA